MLLWLFLVVFTLCGFQPNALTVHIVSMNHLDVGYNGIPKLGVINNILNIYFNEYFPRAITIAQQMKTAGEDRFIYTTHPWLLHMYLHCPTNFVLAGVELECPNQGAVEAMQAAIKRGDITFHAGAFNTEYENCVNAEAVLAQFQLAFDLADELNVPRPTVVSLRDVPGTTRAVLPIMVGAGIKAISIGVNNGSPAPDMPNPGVWMEPNSNASLLFMQTEQSQGYPNNPGTSPDQPGGMGKEYCVRFQGLDHVLCWAFRTDNSGPPMSVDEVNTQFKIARSQFPGAQVIASTYEAFAKELETVRSQLPVTTKEVGDTWITSTTADPVKMAFNRLASREYSSCVKEKKCDPKDPRISQFLRMLAKLPEHTYGVPNIKDSVNYTNQQFQNAFLQEEGAVMDAWNSYTEQRALALDYGMDALADHPLRQKILDEWAEYTPSYPDLSLYQVVAKADWQEPIFLAGVKLTLDGTSGAIIGFESGHRQWADAQHPLAQFLYQTFNTSDYSKFPICCWPDGDRQNLTNAQSGTFLPTMTGLFLRTADDGKTHSILVEMTLPTKLNEFYGAPSVAYLSLSPALETSATGGVITVDLQLFDCPLTRLGNAFMLSFVPAPVEGNLWRMDKLGAWVDPMDVVNKGSQWQHTVNEVRYAAAEARPGSPAFMVQPIDSGVMNPITDKQPAQIFQLPGDTITDPIIGFASQLFQNAFGTNTPLFQWDINYRFRFTIGTAY